MNSLLLALVILPALSPFDPPPGPLPVQPPEFPELEIDTTPEVPDFEEPEVSDGYAAKAAETQDKLDEILAASGKIKEASDTLESLLPSSDGDDITFGLTDDEGDPLSAIDFANSTQSTIATLFNYARVAVHFGSGYTISIFWHLLRAGMFILFLWFVLLLLRILGFLATLIFKAAGLIPSWLLPAVKLFRGGIGI